MTDPQNEAIDRINDQISSNPVILYMKGTPQMPTR